MCLRCHLRFCLCPCVACTHLPQSLSLQEPLFFPLHDENHYGCLLIKQALISGRLKPLQLAIEQRTRSKNKNTLLCIHMPFNQGAGLIKSINKMCVSAHKVNTWRPREKSKEKKDHLKSRLLGVCDTGSVSPSDRHITWCYQQSLHSLLTQRFIPFHVLCVQVKIGAEDRWRHAWKTNTSL